MTSFEKEKLLKAENTYSIGGQIFKVQSYGEFDSKRYLRALAHLEVHDPKEENVRIHLIESKSTGSTPPEEWLNWPTIDPYSGELLEFGDNRAIFNSSEPYFIFVDYASREVYYWVDDFCQLSPNATAAPLLMVFHLWFDPTPLFLFH